MTTAEPSTLAEALAPAAIDFDTLRARHGPFLQLGKRLLGIESNVYPLMEIWPTSFRTYNLMVPNFINLPNPLLGFAPNIGTIGAAMYASSRAAQCMYCSAHCCAIAQRGGADRAWLEAIAAPGDEHTEAQRSVMRVAAGMSTMPASLTGDDMAALSANYKPAAADWLTHSVAMMGFLNKMLDCLGVDIEKALADEVEEVATASGWTPGRHKVVADDRVPFAPTGGPLRTLFAMAPYLPRAVRQDKRWQKGVPAAADAATALLQELAGYDFPMVGRLRQNRLIRTVTTMLRENLDADESVIGLATKHAAGVVFSVGIGNDSLADGSAAMAEAAGVTELTRLRELGRQDLDLDDLEAIAGVIDGLTAERGAALLLARAMTPSPAQVTPAVVRRVDDALTPGQTIELVTWLSLLALLHRLDVVQQAGRASAGQG